MQNIEKMTWLALALALFALPVGAGDDLVTSQLVDQARHWQQKNRDDLAADLWRKLLSTDPKHPEALVKLGAIEARAGNVNEAEALYNRASQFAAHPAGLKELSVAIRAAKGPAKDLPLQPAKQEQRKPAQEMEKTNRDKSPGTKMTNPTAIKSQQNPPVKLPIAKNSSIGTNEDSIITETDDLKLKPSTSLDLVHVKPRP